ncbi:hypothetical protein GEMRC1_009580 [Eukaryota sp. GEM-RC1]
MLTGLCSVCKANVPDSIAVCCDQVVCSQKCLKDWQKSSCTCDSCNAMPSSLVSSPDLVSGSSTSSLAYQVVVQPRYVHCRRSLLVLITSHVLARLWKSDIARDRYHRRLTNILPTFFTQVGYVSQRFLESALLGVNLFLIPTLSPLQLLIFPFFFPSRLTLKQTFNLCS